MMRNQKRGWMRVGGALSALLFCHAALAWENRYEEPEPVQWQENALELPAYPDSADWLAVDVSHLATNRFYLDKKSLVVGSDGVTRYTLIVQTEGGAENVSYEGLRCATWEKRIYALGRSATRTWQEARRSNWEHFREAKLNRIHAALAKELMCDMSAPNNREEILRRLAAQRINQH